MNLDKADVLLNLYNDAQFNGPRYLLQPTFEKSCITSLPAPYETALSVVKARSKIGNYYFSYIDLGSGPKPLRVDLTGFEFDSTLYDRDHGEGLAEKVICKLRSNRIVISKNEDMTSFSYLLSKVGSAISNQGNVSPNENKLTSTENLAPKIATP